MASGIVVLQATTKDTFRSATLRLVGTLIGATIGAFYFYVVSFSPLGMAISVGVTVLLCQMVGVPDHARLAAITVVIILAVSTAALRWLQLLTRRCGLVSHVSVLGSQC